MAKYRKKPVVVAAVQWTGENDIEIRRFVGPSVRFFNGEVYIRTLEGEHHASIGDFIIKGVHGEYYPCKPDIFAETYEPAYTTQETLRPTGRWVHDINNLYGCDQCGERETMSPRKMKRYCPNCGAKMEG